jgi:hypothetical protein
LGGVVVVCDGFGNTGVIVKIDKTPVVREMAVTDNQSDVFSWSAGYEQ